jgi:hypothetical protein
MRYEKLGLEIVLEKPGSFVASQARPIAGNAGDFSYELM